MKKIGLLVCVLVCVFCFLGNASAKGKSKSKAITIATGITNSNGDYDNNGVVNMEDLAEFLAVQDIPNDVKQWINNNWMPQLINCETDLCPENIYEGDYQIYTPEDVEALSGYTKVSGDLKIGCSADQSGYDNLSVVTNLDPLICLSSIGGSLIINENLKLENIDGLNRLSSIGGFLKIRENKILENIDGLNRLSSIGGSLTIKNNPELENVDGLKNLQSINHGLSISSNAKLKNIEGLKNLTSLGETGASNGISISGPMLQSVNGLRNITSNIAYLGISSTDIINLNGIEQINLDGAILYIAGNDSLTDISALSGVTSLKKLTIHLNESLTNLNGLQNLETLDEYLSITKNNVLSNIDALSNLCSVAEPFGCGQTCNRGIYVKDNPALCTNIVEALQDQISDCPGGGFGDTIRLVIDDNMDCN